MKKRIVRSKERIQTFFTMDLYRPAESDHEESCNITLFVNAMDDEDTPLFRHFVAVLVYLC